MGDGGLAVLCASIGSLQAHDDGSELYVKSPDCLENMRDLQRYLRRDHPQTRDVFLQLGKWNIVRQDLVPIMKRYSDDFELVLNCMKVLVFLTMPVDPTSNQVSQQMEYLQHFKIAIVEGDVVAVIVSLLEEPLQHLESGCPKDDDWKMFQLFLTLVRNFLSFPDSLPQHGPPSTQLSNLRDRMLDRLFNESAMDLVVALTQHVGGHGGLRQDNVLILEIIQHVFSGQRADLVAAAVNKKSMKQSDKSVATLRNFLQAEKEQRRCHRKGDSAFTGMFVQVAQDGSKTMSTRNLQQSPLEDLIRKPQIKRGFIKRIVQEPQPLIPSDENIYVLLKDFTDQFLASGYNILMQSVKEDILRERPGFETPDTVAFFQVAQFFIRYECCVSQIHQRTADGVSLTGAENEAAAQNHLCSRIASTMDDDMFNMVMSKWHDYADSTEITKDWGPAAATGGTMKDMICMLDLVLKRSGTLTKEGQQELRTARVLLYNILYDQTENGILHFLNSLIKSFDMYKQPRSYLADLVEITHVILRVLENFEKAGDSLQVLKKVRGRWKKKRKPGNTPAEQPQNGGVEQDATEAQADGKAPNVDEHPLDLAPHVGVSTQHLDQGPLGHKEIAENMSATDGEAPPKEQYPVELENKTAIRSHEEDEEERFHMSPEVDNNDDDDDSDGEKQKGTTEVSFNMSTAVMKFANNAVVRSYCWLLKFYSSNAAAVNYYVVRMLQRICEDCMLEPMFYQISILQTFHNILSDRTMQAAEDQGFIIPFLTKLVFRLLKKLESQPILFVDILFWKSRIECHTITADYMIHSLRKETGGSSQKPQKKINIADALGDDEEEAFPPMNADSDNEGSAAWSDDNDVQGPEESSLFSEAQVAQIRDLFERYKNDEQMAELIAMELDSSVQYTAAQVLLKLQQLGLLQPTPNQSKMKGGSRSSKNEKVPGRQPPGKSRIFSEAQDAELRELFTRHGSSKNVTKVITQSLGGEFTIAQVSRRLRTLGLVKSKARTTLSSPHANLTDGEEDDNDDNRPRTVTNWSQEEGSALPHKTRKKHTRKRGPNTIDVLDSDDVVLISGLVPTQKQNDGDNMTSKLNRLPKAQDQVPGELSDRDGSGKNVTKVGDNLDKDLTTVPVSRKLRRVGLVKSKMTTALSSCNDNLPDNAGDDDPHQVLRTVTDLSDEDENPSPGKKGEKHRRKRRINTVDLYDSEDDIPSSGLHRPAPGLAQKLDDEGDVPISGLNRLARVPSQGWELDLVDGGFASVRSKHTPSQAQDVDSEDDVLISGSSRPAPMHTQELSSEDDVLLSGFSRPAPRQAQEVVSYEDVLISGMNKPTSKPTRDLDSVDDDLISGSSSRPAPRQAVSDEDVLISGFISRPAPRQAVGDEDVLISCLNKSVPKPARDLDSDDDVLMSVLSRPEDG